jgi:hypothetical protein
MLMISLPITAMITSYARLRMYENKELFGADLLYSDTDSWFSNTKLPDHLIGNELGEMKLEYEAVDAIFLAPKVYGV